MRISLASMSRSSRRVPEASVAPVALCQDVTHAYDYFRFTLMGQENSRAKLNIMMVVDGLKLHELPDGDVRPFTERVTEVPRAVRNAREMARSIGIERLDNVLIDGYYIHPKALEPVE